MACDANHLSKRVLSVLEFEREREFTPRFLSKSVFDGSIKNYARYGRCGREHRTEIGVFFCLLPLLVIFGCHCGVAVNAQSSMPAGFISLNQVWGDFMNINCPGGGLPRRALDFSLSHYFSSMNAVLNNSVIVTSP
jgi:hypothetical protein